MKEYVDIIINIFTNMYREVQYDNLNKFHELVLKNNTDVDQYYLEFINDELYIKIYDSFPTYYDTLYSEFLKKEIISEEVLLKTLLEFI